MTAWDPGDADMSWRRDNLGYLLFATADALIRHKLRIVGDAGFTALSHAQLALFEHIEIQGSRLTDLATRSGLAKQSMIELIDRSAQRGLVERAADPSDKRAKIVTLTVDGACLARIVAQARSAAQTHFVEIVGRTGTDRLRHLLLFYAGLGRSSDRPPPLIEELAEQADSRFVRTVLANAHQRGYRSVTEALLSLFRNLEITGSRLTDVANVARVTKQSMRDLVDRAEALGLVDRIADNDDRRAKIIRFSSAGFTMLEEMAHSVTAAEADFERSGPDASLVDAKATMRLFVERHHLPSPSAASESRSISSIRA